MSHHPSHYDRLFERFTSSNVARYWHGITIRQNSAMLFYLEDVLEVCRVEKTDLMIERLRERWRADGFSMKFEGNRWHYWASLPACLSIVRISPELRDRMKTWERDRLGIIDRIC
jgi:hypothetical protein